MTDLLKVLYFHFYQDREPSKEVLYYFLFIFFNLTIMKNFLYVLRRILYLSLYVP